MTDRYRLYFEPEAYFAALIDDIEKAQRSLIVETYIFQLDDVGERVLSALVEAVARQVELRILIDGIGSYRDATRIAERLDLERCELRVFHPLPWDFSLYRRALKADRWYSQLLYLIASLNHRDHRKLCIVDDEIAWLGSFNITADHFNRDSKRPGDFWHDTGLRVSGDVVADLRLNFINVWQRKAAAIGERSRRFLAGEERSRRRRQQSQLVQLLDDSKRRIWITNAYFNPSRRVLKILKHQAQQGVSIKLIVPSRSDIFVFPHLSRGFYADLLRVGIQVYEYGHRVLHSKSMLIDDRVVIGSTNLNYRSLLHDLELDILLNDPDILRQMQQRFDANAADSIEITLDKWQRHPRMLRLVAWLSRFLRYWL